MFRVFEPNTTQVLVRQ